VGDFQVAIRGMTNDDAAEPFKTFCIISNLYLFISPCHHLNFSPSVPLRASTVIKKGTAIAIPLKFHGAEAGI
jgi:hypothetical protein